MISSYDTKIAAILMCMGCILGILGYGLIFSIVLFIGLALANFKLAWSGNYMLAIIMMVIEISGFTENQMVSVMISFAAIFALIAYMPKWIHRADKDVLNEQ